MSISVQTNMQSLAGQRSLVNASRINDDAMAKLASGYRINKAADDAAGLAISDKLKSDIRGLGVAQRNANDGISMLQTAEGGMNEVGNILTRLRELSVQAASDTIGNTDRKFLQKEFSQLKSEIDRISMATEYNGTVLLSGGSTDGLPPGMVKNSNAEPIEIQIGKNWFASIDGDDTAQDATKAESTKDGAAKAGEATTSAKHNPINVLRIGFKDFNTTTGSGGLGIGKADDESMESTGVYMASDEGKSKNRAQLSLEKIDKALEKLSGYRAEIGAYQNRLGSTTANLSVEMENYTAANSRIRDTDFAAESARLTQSNILKQAAVSVLAQANQSPSLALRLLGQ